MPGCASGPARSTATPSGGRAPGPDRRRREPARGRARAAHGGTGGWRWPGALVGGLAVSARAEPRFTRDLDLAVAVADDAEAESLVGRFLADGCTTVTLVEQEQASRLATVRLALPEEGERGVVVDLLFASSGIEPEIVREAEPLEVFAGVRVPVARVGHLVALKLLARDDRTRPQDAFDLRALLAVLTSNEMARAREAVRLIAARGFARGRDLADALERLLGSSG